jgi:hypothetical protein
MPKSGLVFIATHKTIFCSIGGPLIAVNQHPAIQRGRTRDYRTGGEGDESLVLLR